jgi:hypothetical protein
MNQLYNILTNYNLSKLQIEKYQIIQYPDELVWEDMITRFFDECLYEKDCKTFSLTIFTTFHNSNMAYNLIEYNEYSIDEFETLLSLIIQHYSKLENTFNELQIHDVYFAYEIIS